MSACENNLLLYINNPCHCVQKVLYCLAHKIIEVELTNSYSLLCCIPHCKWRMARNKQYIPCSADCMRWKIMKWLVMCYMTLYICGFYFCVVNSSSSLIPLRSKPTASALPINHVQNYRYLLWSKQKNTPVHKQFYTFHFVQFGDLWFQFIPQSLNFNIQCLLICSMHVNRSRQCIGLLLHVCECDIHYAHDHLPPVSWYKLVCPS